MQQPSGVFAGDSFGEVDTRFSYCAVSALSLLGRLSELDVEKTVSYIKKCRNFDGGFGSTIGAESHAAQGGQFMYIMSCIVLIGHPSFRLRWGISYTGST
jgi:prenyltransferase beta subunit